MPFLRKNGHRPIAAIRSSIKSRSTSQALSADRRRLSIFSASADWSAFSPSGHHDPESLLDFRRVRLGFDVREVVRLNCPATIGNFLPGESFSGSSHRDGTAVVKKK
jgi:hypothetical protein